ncbi:GAF domain-containing sensor histidine kinase [Mucilaginibacter psychrotolerans]|uniref:histidine kinase n=1 Tax=Mucilaginibacter psychrotolerans TaxID=1524096 RepID=A0A4Y8S8H5_9SPHI|nr:GAF domain-containing sensor histidine kinase [Mucilaginibacter psychrotolerans]TFF35329.1 sensor histidine kinase [Mucilaginibacter psychrotolerans]
MDPFIKQVSLIPLNDEERLRKLYKYEILDTPADKTFDKIATLAAQIFDTPSAFVSFVDQDRVFVKAKVDTNDTFKIPEEAIARLAVLSADTTVISDMLLEPILSAAPVLVNTSVRFYAGTPIKTPDGHLLGTVSVVDAVPRVVTEKQLEMLKNLSEIIVDELELRQTTRNIVRVQTDLMNIAVHDIKNPLTAISLYAKLIKQKSTEEPIRTMAEKVTNASQRILEDLNELLNLAKVDNGAMMLHFENVNTTSLIEKAVNNLQVLAEQKHQKILLHLNCKSMARLDKGRIAEVFENLLSNAIKYSRLNTWITICSEEKDGNLIVEFSDQGQGLNEEDMKKLFTKFARLSSIPTNKETSNGLGLSIAKILVELHNGKIWAESKGKDMGASFFVSLPLLQR